MSLSFLSGPVLDVAPRLLGARLATLVEGARVVVELTEVEAYDGENDPGSHAFRGPTPRTQPMFGPSGHLYVYFSYGMHWCANIVTGTPGSASAVLLRAGRVVDGVGIARQRRPAARRDVDLARGPARLAACLALDGTWSGHPIDGTRVSLEVPEQPLAHENGPRVGVSGPGGSAVDHPWRFWLPGDPTVSPYRAAAPRRSRSGRSQAADGVSADPERLEQTSE